MREIKFKIYRDSKLWGIEELRADGWYSMCYELNPDKGERWSHIVFRDEGFIRAQYTGLKDKNGKEIYEGDVLVMNIERDFKKSHSKPFPMQWNPHNAAWTNFHPREIVEVIGNIYENPELIQTP